MATTSPVRSPGIVTLVRLPHAENAKLPIRVTLSGIVTLVRLPQWQNALAPMLLTLSGIVTLLLMLLFLAVLIGGGGLVVKELFNRVGIG